MKSNKRKTVAGITAGVLALAIALTGTYAWQSINQTALNETIRSLNPGGRLHDDFNGENKDVYVENFTTATDGGTAIFARVRLDEYMETGKDAGINREDGSRDATPLKTGASINDKSTWSVHIPEATDDPFHDLWDWDMGGKTTFMPTFNKNKDSLSADINGTYEGTIIGDTTHYDDYVDYSDPANASKTGNAVYDIDDDSDDEEETAVEGTDIKTVEETHTTQETQTAIVLTMQQWMDMGAPIGEYWVYDTDGWAYWAQPIQPGETTGLLLDGIRMTKDLDEGETCYYAINVVAQFATANDWGSEEDNSGFYDRTKGAAPTAEAIALMEKITGKQESLKITAAGDAYFVYADETMNFSAALGTEALAATDVTWAVSNNESAQTTIDANGLLTVGDDEYASSLTVTAKYKKTGATAEYQIAVTHK